MENQLQAEAVPEEVDESSPTVLKFVKLLEQRMLEGHSEASNRTWATLEVGVPLEKFLQIQAILLKQWNLNGLPADVARQQRNVIRRRYEFLYQKSIEKDRLKDALHALDAMVKLDGLDTPPEGSVEAGIVGGLITNAARESIGRLIEKARNLGMQGVPRPEALPPGEDFEQKPNGNGHSKTNGKSMVIDLREPKK